MSEQDIFPIKSGQDWGFKQIQAVYNELDRIALEKYGLSFYPNQIEIVTSEQMLDAYAGHGMPIMYKHWSFGKSFIQQSNEYRRGNMGLAYEMVINSNPCINYLMEENSMMMQSLVMAHAAFGHNCFFKTNYLFKQWTDADAIIDYLMYSNEFIRTCEEKYGVAEVEQILDAAHAWQYYGVDKYKRPSPLTDEKSRLAAVEFEEYKQKMYNFVLDRSVDKIVNKKPVMTRQESDWDAFEREENILYFVEKHAPNMPQWKREIIRIVRKMAQYFYPQIQTKVMNEGFATFMHYHLIHDLRDEGLVDQGFMLEFYASHTGVVKQQPMSANFNPYALGFAMFMDIKRICIDPTEEDIDWFSGQKWVGGGDWIGTVKWAAENFKDESFIRQFLSPALIREFKMFVLEDDRNEDFYRVTAIHDPRGYQEVRSKLADRYLWTKMFPEIQVSFFDEKTDRALYLTQNVQNGMYFDVNEMTKVAMHLATLWEFPVIVEAEQEAGRSDLSVTVIPLDDGEFDVSTEIYDPT